MDEHALFTKFWEHETKTTGKVIERIPEGSTYRPDPKSRTASEIAWQIACEEKMLIDGLERGTMEWTPTPCPATVREIVDAYSAHSADMVRRLKALPAERWAGTLDFFGKQRHAAPMAWCFVLDLVHQLGQISTYTRTSV